MTPHQTTPEQVAGPLRRASITTALSLIVFVSGGAVMIYEFIAVRILQRFFGSSLDVWAAEISVCLAGLAVGYFIGGFLVDRFRSWIPLGIVLCVAGSSAYYMERVIVRTAEWIPQAETVRWWEPLFVSGVATFVPLLALGTVMPQAIGLRVHRIERVGLSAGLIAALSTTGSICGTLLTSSVFVRWGVLQSLQTTCWVLIALGAVTLLINFANRRAAASALLLVTALAAPVAARAQVLFEDYSSYHHIMVRDEGGKRVLWFDDAPQTTMSVHDPYSGGFEYTEFFHVPLLIDPTINSVLFVGLGGGTGPKAFYRYYPSIKVDVAEIDPAVVKVAHEFFGVPKDPRLRIATADGRVYLQRSRAAYGAIIMDAYGSGPNGAYLPYHLATAEFFQAAWSRLVNGGCLVYNVMGTYRGQNDDIVRGMVRTLETVFQAVYVFEARSSYNTVFVAQKIDYNNLAPNGTREGKGWPDGPWLTHPINFAALHTSLASAGVYFPPAFPGRLAQFSGAHSARRTGQIFTDNNAPVDLAPGRR